MQIYCTSQLYGLMLPATLGADALRVVLAAAEDRPSAQVTASVIMERVLGVVVTLVTCLTAMLAAGFHTRGEPALFTSVIILGAATVIMVLAALASMNQRLFPQIHQRLLGRFAAHRVVRILRQLHEGYLTYARRPALLALFMIWTVVEILLGALFLSILLYALGVQVSFLFVVAAFNAAALLARIPISIAGLGVFEAGFVYLLSIEGVATEAALLAALLSRLLQLAAWLPWWAGYLVARPDASRIREEHAGRKPEEGGAAAK
jgi:glycosyltransferase 2 family protein